MKLPRFLERFKELGARVDDADDQTAAALFLGAPFTMTSTAYEQAMGHLTVRSVEAGVVVGGYEADRVARVVSPDLTADHTGTTYSPDFARVNELLRGWNRAGLRLLSIIHTHPGSFCRLSRGDLEYAARILAANEEMPRLVLPIVTLVPHPQMFCHAVYRDGEHLRVEAVPLVVVPEVTLSDREAWGAVQGEEGGSNQSVRVDGWLASRTHEVGDEA